MIVICSQDYGPTLNPDETITGTGRDSLKRCLSG